MPLRKAPDIPSRLSSRKWSPAIAGLLSFLLPGAGQLYKGQRGASLLWFVSVLAGYIALIVPGVILHLYCISDAVRSDPHPFDTSTGRPLTPESVVSLTLLLAVALLTAATLLVVKRRTSSSLQYDQSPPGSTGIPAPPPQPSVPDITTTSPAVLPAPDTPVDMSTSPPDQPDLQPSSTPGPSTDTDQNTVDPFSRPTPPPAATPAPTPARKPPASVEGSVP